MKRAILVAALVLSSAFGAHASDPAVYSNGFEGAVGSEWSTSRTDTTPVGARSFLGQFCNDEVTLSLHNLPVHTTARVSFDLYLIRSWDGNAPEWGPDIWDFGVAGQTPTIHTTFALTPASPNDHQSYPNTYPSGNYYERTGAAENNTLGYIFSNWLWPNGIPLDCVYHFSVDLPHSDSDITLFFRASGLQATPLQNGTDPDESWGLDNVSVSVSSVPEPCGLPLLLTGLPVAAAVIRRNLTQAGAARKASR